MTTSPSLGAIAYAYWREGELLAQEPEYRDGELRGWNMAFGRRGRDGSQVVLRKTFVRSAS